MTIGLARLVPSVVALALTVAACGSRAGLEVASSPSPVPSPAATSTETPSPSPVGTSQASASPRRSPTEAAEPPGAIRGECGGDEIARAAKPPAGVSITIATDRAEYGSGEEVRISLTLENGGTRSLEIATNGSPHENVFVWRDETFLWRTGTDPEPQVYLTETVPPGETVRRSFLWDMRACSGDGTGGAPVAKGRFTVAGYFVRSDDGYGGTGYGEYWSAERSFVIE